MSQFSSSTRRTRPRAFFLLAAGLTGLLLTGGCDSDGPFVTKRAIARVLLFSPARTLEVGENLAITAAPFDHSGRVIDGKWMVLSSSNESVATVSQDGIVTGHALGPVTITAISEGIRGTLSLSVVEPPPARVAVAPRFASVGTSETTAFRAAALAATGDTVRGAAITWSTTTPGVATVNASGTVTGVSEGIARVVARTGNFADTATVAVLGARTLLSTVFPGGSIHSDVRAGQTFSVPVVLDMTRFGSDGDLGSIQFDVVFDPAVLQYESAASALQGSAESNLVSPGRVRFAFVSTTPQGNARLTVAALTFRVLTNAPVGTTTALDLAYTVAPTRTGFDAYEIPLTVGGRVRVAAP